MVLYSTNAFSRSYLYFEVHNGEIVATNQLISCQKRQDSVSSLLSDFTSLGSLSTIITLMDHYAVAFNKVRNP